MSGGAAIALALGALVVGAAAGVLVTRELAKRKITGGAESLAGKLGANATTAQMVGRLVEEFIT